MNIVILYLFELEQLLLVLEQLYIRGVSSLGSARNLAREPHVFKSSARLGSISGSSRKLEVIFFGSKARTITRP